MTNTVHIPSYYRAKTRIRCREGFVYVTPRDSATNYTVSASGSRSQQVSSSDIKHYVSQECQRLGGAIGIALVDRDMDSSHRRDSDTVGAIMSRLSLDGVGGRR